MKNFESRKNLPHYYVVSCATDEMIIDGKLDTLVWITQVCKGESTKRGTPIEDSEKIALCDMLHDYSARINSERILKCHLLSVYKNYRDVYKNADGENLAVIESLYASLPNGELVGVVDVPEKINLVVQQDLGIKFGIIKPV